MATVMTYVTPEYRKMEAADAAPDHDATSCTLHAGAHRDWVVPWAGITVPRGTSVRLVRDAAGRWVEVRE